MSDSILGSVADAGKDIVKETVQQVKGGPKSVAQTATQQLTGYTSEEDELQKKQKQIETYQRIKAIEAEMAQIRADEEKKQGPQIQGHQAQKLDEESNNVKPKKIDEASRQALGRAEQGRNYKG